MKNKVKQKAHFSELFQISFSEKFGTINGCKFCDPYISNNYDSINGGWGYIIVIKKNYTQTEIKYSLQVENTTNNRMELTAIIEALNKVNYLLKDKFSDCKKINIYTDSAYIQNCYSQQWYIKWLKNGWVNSKKEAVKNKDLWTQLIPYFENERFSFLKVKGHNGII